MRIVSLKIPRAFWEKHAKAEQPLRTWFKNVEKADWATIIDVRKTYSNADAVLLKNGAIVTMFNVGGGNYRVITSIVYPIRHIYVKMVLTHADYDKEKWKESLCRD